MNLETSIFGALSLEVTSADPEEILTAISLAGFEIGKIQRKTDLTITFSVSRKGYPAVLALCKKQGANIKILRRSGLYWRKNAGSLHPFLLTGLALLLTFSIFLPTRVFFVRIQGNDKIPAKRILQAVQDCGIGFGASRRAVRSEKAKNALLANLPELEWVGVNTSGCVAEVSVRERSVHNTPKESNGVSHIVSDMDGFILSMTVTRGTPLCAPGQQVNRGQVLVSGYTDCGIFIRATSSQAEIMAQTNRHLEVISPSQALFRGEETGRMRKYSLLVGKKRINLWKGSGIQDTSCGRIYEEKYVTLPGYFQLPLALCVEEYVFYDTAHGAVTSQSALSGFAEGYLAQHMVAGTILKKAEQIAFETGVYHLIGDYICQEMIGRVQQEQIGEVYGKSNGEDRKR